MFCSISVKNAVGNLIGITLNRYIAFGSIVIFTVLSLPTQKHEISLHLFMSSLISFISVLKFSVYSSFVSLGRFIPRYFILFVAVVNGVDSLISLSDFSLLVYRNASDFCVLILYPVTLLNSLVSSSNFLIVSLGFLCIVSCHLQSVRALLLFWSGLLLFLYLLITVARISKPLYSSGESGHPCLVLILGAMLSVFHHWE